MERRLFWKEFWLLWGVTTLLSAIVLAFARIPATYFAMRLLLSGHSWGPLMYGVELVQTALVLAIAAGVGLRAAQALGLGAPILEGLLRREPVALRIKTMIVPVLLVGALVGAIQVMAELPIFRPNRRVNHELVLRIARGPESPRLDEKLRQTSGPINRFTPAMLFINEFRGTLAGEIISRLFVVSGIAWLLARAVREEARPPGWKVLGGAILIATVVLTVSSFVSLEETDRQLRGYLHDVLPNMPRDPLWSLIARRFLRSVPGDLGLGWLYVRYGLESAILAVLVAGIVGQELVMDLISRLY